MPGGCEGHAAMQTACLDYTDREHAFEAYVAHAGGGGRRLCVLVAHQWAGQSDYERGKADELAEMGCVASRRTFTARESAAV